MKAFKEFNSCSQMHKSVYKGFQTGPVLKDTDSKHIDSIHGVFVVIPVERMITAQQNFGLTSVWLQKYS